MRCLWDNHKILDFCPPKTRFCSNSCRNLQREGKNSKFFDCLRDPARGPKTFLETKYYWFDVSFYVVGMVYRYLGLWKNSIFCLMSNFWRFQLSHFGAKFWSWICGLFVCSHRACRIFYGPKSIQNLSNDLLPTFWWKNHCNTMRSSEGIIHWKMHRYAGYNHFYLCPFRHVKHSPRSGEYSACRIMFIRRTSRKIFADTTFYPPLLRVFK